MGKNSTAKQTKGESAYAKRQRRRAEGIINATGRYSVELRSEVQAALDTVAWRLPVLFREADRIDERLASIGRSIRAEYRKAGIPLGELPIKRSPKPSVVRWAEEIESLMVEHENDRLDEHWGDRAQLISDILYELHNTVEIYATHSALVRAYVLTIWDKLLSLESRHDYETVQRSFAEIHDLMHNCSEARFEEINRIYNPQEYDDLMRKFAAARTDIECQQSEPDPKLVSVRDQLSKLENLPENEAERFSLESEIYQLEREAESDLEWPEVVGEGGHNGSL